MKTPDSPFALTGKVAIVTGAARGIGRSIADAFVAADARHVVCADILEDALGEIKTSDRLSTALLDVTDESNWQSVVEATLERHGQIDILVNNAGILAYATIENTDPADFRRVLEVNVTGVFLGMRTLIPHMKANRRGVIINSSSSSALVPNNFISAYAASKFAVRGLTRSASLELGLHGIRVNSIHPGGINTPMTNPTGEKHEDLAERMPWVPIQRYGKPEEVAKGVVFLASDAASYCMGTELQIDGGMTAGTYFPGMPGSPENPQ